MAGIRRFFWNIRKSFIGPTMLTYAPFQAAMLPVGIILPAFVFMEYQKGKFILKPYFNPFLGNIGNNVYYDLYDSDTSE